MEGLEWVCLAKIREVLVDKLSRVRVEGRRVGKRSLFRKVGCVGRVVIRGWVVEIV